ncbi:MAG: hypothetical protein VX641_02645 [Planctomycetota bacterium]|nr:hypothetical protein [Planctomycetota bacterium]
MDDPQEFEPIRNRRPHWQRKAFWKTFGTVLVIYFVIRIAVTTARKWSEAPPAAPAEVETPDSTSGG